FQAEDGIRDFHVTGVQTCALPILSRADTPGSYVGIQGACGTMSYRSGAHCYPRPVRTGSTHISTPARHTVMGISTMRQTSATIRDRKSSCRERVQITVDDSRSRDT